MPPRGWSSSALPIVDNAATTARSGINGAPLSGDERFVLLGAESGEVWIPEENMPPIRFRDR